MLVSVYKDGQGAKEDPVRLNFETTPAVGEMVELDGQLLTVSQAWHRPDESCVGSKFAVLLRPQGQVKAA